MTTYHYMVRYCDYFVIANLGTGSRFQGWGGNNKNLGTRFFEPPQEFAARILLTPFNYVVSLEENEGSSCL